jgi:hypothetical protein
MRLREWLRQSSTSQGREPADVQLARILDEQGRILRSFGLPLPALREPAQMTAVGLRMPLFDLTGHPYFPVQARARDYIGYFLLCERSDSRRALDVLERDGLHEVVRRFPGVWLNRDPYLLYRALNRYAAYGDGFSLNADLRRWLPIRPLWVVKGFTVDEVFDRITWRARFFSGVIDKFPVAVENPEMPGANCNDALQLAATIPARALPDRRAWHEDLLAFRAVPAAEMPPSCATARNRELQSGVVALLEAARAAGGCFGLEILPSGERMECRFLCSARRWRLVCEHVEGRFPSLAAVTDQEDSRPPSPLYRVEILPASPFLRCWMPDGPTLLPILKTAASWCCLQVLFAPLSPRFASLLRQELAHIRFLDLSRSRKLDEFGLQSEGWQVTVRVFGAQAEVVERVRDCWLTEDARSVWRTSGMDVRQDFDRRIEAWEIVGREELAELLRLLALGTGGDPESPCPPPQLAA